MVRKRNVQIGVVIVLIAMLSVSHLWSRWPILLHAQDEPPSNDDPAAARDQQQIFLPFIVEGATAGRDLTEPDQITPTVEIVTPPVGHDHGQPIFESWPPQPIGITAIQAITAVAPDTIVGSALAATRSAIAAAEAVALASPDVQSALGATFVHASTSHSQPKGNMTAATNAATKPVTEISVTYYSYSNNNTVEALVQAGAVTNVRALPAAVYQPEPTVAERTNAVAIARNYFQAAGESRVTELQGFVIMAYRAQGATGFYDSRVLYVTFHENLEERPEYLAWVDLREGRVIKGVKDSLERHANSALQLGSE